MYMKSDQLNNISLKTRRASAVTGIISFGNQHHFCTLGRSGISAFKHEGDGATPRANMNLHYVLYRADRLARPQTGLPIFPLTPEDGWCDDPQDANYNKPVAWPYAASAEHLWRKDNIYDLIVVLDYNLGPCKKQAGSAIFWHLSRPDLSPTQGCIATSQKDLLMMLKKCSPKTKLLVR